MKNFFAFLTIIAFIGFTIFMIATLQCTDLEIQQELMVVAVLSGCTGILFLCITNAIAWRERYHNLVAAIITKDKQSVLELLETKQL